MGLPQPLVKRTSLAPVNCRDVVGLFASLDLHPEWQEDADPRMVDYDIPGKPAAHHCSLLSKNCGLLWDTLACCSGVVGFPGTYLDKVSTQFGTARSGRAHHGAPPACQNTAWAVEATG